MEEFKNYFKKNKCYSLKHLFKDIDWLSKEEIKSYLDILLKEGFLIFKDDKYELFCEDYFEECLNLDDDKTYLNSKKDIIDENNNLIIEDNILAILEFKNNKAYLYNSDYEIKLDDEYKLVTGDIFVVRFKKTNNKIKTNFIEKIGHVNDPDINLKAIALSKSFDLYFSKESMKQLSHINTYVTKEELKDRLDLRDELIYTIDGSDTKDMDDAISVKVNEKGNYVLGVHIADVSHYIKIKSPLFNEALNRGNSLYMVDSVIPMLPHELSNGICSLNPNCDRLTLSCIMEIDKKGKIIDYKIVESVINSKKKMTYEDVDKILMENEIVAGYEDFVDNLKLCNELSFILSNNYKNHGYLHFKSNEVKVSVDRLGNPVSFNEITPRAGRKIIENFMLAANKTIASEYAYMPFAFRIHEVPDELDIKETFEFLESIGYDITHNTNLNNPLKLNQILKNLYDSGNYSITSQFVLKAMKKAKYSPVNVGHFGLGFSEYTHFTSPIRRFNDLLVHTLIKAYNNPKLSSKSLMDLDKQLVSTCEHISKKEVLADEAENEAIKLKMVEYMENHIDDYFNGKIINLGPKYITVKLENNIVGMVSLEDIKDRTHFDNNSYSIVGNNNSYKIGDYIRVKTINVSRFYKTINFKLIEKINPAKQKKLTKN